MAEEPTTDDGAGGTPSVAPPVVLPVVPRWAPRRRLVGANDNPTPWRLSLIRALILLTLLAATVLSAVGQRF